MVRHNLTQIDFKLKLATFYSTSAIVPAFQIQKFYLSYYL